MFAGAHRFHLFCGPQKKAANPARSAASQGYQ